MYARIFPNFTVPISSLENNPAVDHDPISAERSVHIAIRNGRVPRSIVVIKWPFVKATQEFPRNMDLIYSPMLTG